MADGDGKQRGFLIVALVVSILALMFVPILGYILFAAFAVLAWVRGEPRLTRWTLTLIAAALIVLTVLGWSTGNA